MIKPNLTDNFKFKYKISYSELYQAVERSDYIILPFNPKDKYSNEYKNFKVSGSMQLVYGFLKPALIHQEFANFYNLNNKNSLIYNNFNFYDVMKQAILLSNKIYKNLQDHLQLVERQIYKTSINNIKKTIINNY